MVSVWRGGSGEEVLMMVYVGECSPTVDPELWDNWIDEGTQQSSNSYTKVAPSLNPVICTPPLAPLSPLPPHLDVNVSTRWSPNLYPPTGSSLSLPSSP